MTMSAILDSQWLCVLGAVTCFCTLLLRQCVLLKQDVQQSMLNFQLAAMPPPYNLQQSRTAMMSTCISCLCLLVKQSAQHRLPILASLPSHARLSQRSDV